MSIELHSSVGGRWGDNDATTEDNDDGGNNVASEETSYFNTSSHLQVRLNSFLSRILRRFCDSIKATNKIIWTNIYRAWLKGGPQVW